MSVNAGIKKVIIAIFENDVAPRFDLTTEVLVVRLQADGRLRDEQIVILPHASAEAFCHMLLKEEADVLICGGIEEEFYQYLLWKNVAVIDSVMGPWHRVLKTYLAGELVSGQVLYEVGAGN